MTKQFIPQRNNNFEVHFDNNDTDDEILQSLTLSISSIEILFTSNKSILMIKFNNYKDLEIYQRLKELYNIQWTLNIKIVGYLPDGSYPQTYLSGNYILSEIILSLDYTNSDVNTIHTKFIQVDDKN